MEVKVKAKAKVAQMVKVKASVHAKWQLSDKINKNAASVSHKQTHAQTVQEFGLCDVIARKELKKIVNCHEMK